MFFNYCHMRSCPLARVYVLRGRQIEPSLHRPPLPKLTRYFRKSAHNSLVMSQNEFSGGKSRRAPQFAPLRAKNARTVFGLSGEIDTANRDFQLKVGGVRIPSGGAEVSIGRTFSLNFRLND